MYLVWGWLLLLYCHQSEAAQDIVSSKVAAKLGSTATLPCTFSVSNTPIDTKRLQIIWMFNDKVILTYCSNMTVKEPRASMEVRRLKNGIASLTLSNVTMTDDGAYKCVVMYDTTYKEESVSLSVTGLSMAVALTIVILAAAFLIGGVMWCTRVCKNKRSATI